MQSEVDVLLTSDDPVVQELFKIQEETSRVVINLKALYDQGQDANTVDMAFLARELEKASDRNDDFYSRGSGASRFPHAGSKIDRVSTVLPVGE